MAYELVRVSEFGDLTCPADPGEPGMGKPRVSVTDDEAQALTKLARGRLVLEIGTGLGISTRALAAGALAVYSIDVDPWVHATVWPTLAELDNIAFFTSPKFVPQVDLVFVDGQHDRESVEQDIYWAQKKCKSGGRIVLHDYRHPPVKEAAKGLEVERVIVSKYGIGIFKHG